MRIPDGVAWLADDPTGAPWISRLGRLVREVRELWDVEIDEDRPFPGCTVSWSAPGRWRDTDVVVKLQWPHPDAAHEAAALAAWGGEGAAMLLAHDAARSALLLERCRPGVALGDVSDERIDPLAVLAAIIRRLAVEVESPFDRLADVAAGWADGLVGAWERAGCPCERRLVDAALDAIAELAPVQGPQVLIHQDLHPGNVLASTRLPWLAIDPKPVVGELAFAVAPVVRAVPLGHDPISVSGRLHWLSAELGVDRERARGWTIAQAMAWSFGSPWEEHAHQTVRWLLEDAGR